MSSSISLFSSLASLHIAPLFDESPLQAPQNDPLSSPRSITASECETVDALLTDKEILSSGAAERPVSVRLDQLETIMRLFLEERNRLYFENEQIRAELDACKKENRMLAKRVSILEATTNAREAGVSAHFVAAAPSYSSGLSERSFSFGSILPLAAGHPSNRAPSLEEASRETQADSISERFHFTRKKPAGDTPHRPSSAPPFPPSLSKTSSLRSLPAMNSEALPTPDFSRYTQLTEER